jgi:cytochrome b involved in lipid metabolism
VKKLIYTAFVAFWSIVLTLVLLDRLQLSEPEPAPRPAPDAEYTLEQVARHNRASDCWMAIERGVYRLTDYLSRHPTSNDVMTEWCGREATQAMRTKGRSGGRDHSQRAWRMLERYRIGSLSD